MAPLYQPPITTPGLFNPRQGGGISTGISNPFVNVPIDGPNGWYIPETTAHFQALGLPVPDYLWLCQESTGNLANSIGASQPFVAIGSPLYQQTVPGWTRKFVASTGTVNYGFRVATTAFAMALSESAAMVTIGCVSDAATNNFYSQYTAASPTNALGFATGTGRLRVHHSGVAVVSAAGPNHFGIDTAHMTVWFRNCATGQSGGVTELDSVTNVHWAQASSAATNMTLATVSGSRGRYTWVAVYKGANAERDWSTYIATLRG